MGLGGLVIHCLMDKREESGHKESGYILSTMWAHDTDSQPPPSSAVGTKKAKELSLDALVVSMPLEQRGGIAVEGQGVPNAPQRSPA